MTQETLYLDQLNRYYSQYLRGVIQNAPFSPIVLRGGKNKPDTYAELQEAISCFQKFEKIDNKKGWTIIWQEWNSKKVGNQKWPSELRVETEEDYLMLVKREKESVLFKAQLANLIAWRLGIKTWLLEKVNKVLEVGIDWPGICAVVDYVLSNPVSNHYLRSLPVPVHTKFIERYDSTILSLVRHFSPQVCISEENKLETALGFKRKHFLFPLRVLDANLQNKLISGAEVLGISAITLRNINWQVSELWLVENETALYMLPTRHDAIAICSKGYALSELKNIPLFEKSPLYYWGDMDEDGFNLLNMCRQMYANTQSVFMDETSFLFHEKEMDKQPAIYRKQELPVLKEHERRAFNSLKEYNGRIEQEKLQLSFVEQIISMLK